MTSPLIIEVFGATGSIGESTMKVLRSYRKPFIVQTLTGNTNIKTMLSLAREFKPKNIGMMCKSSAVAVAQALEHELPECSVVGGFNDIINLAKYPADCSVMGISGLVDALPILSTLTESSRKIALANKESIVCAGNIILDKASKFNTSIIPVDSEHNAIFRLIHVDNNQRLFERITLTASGGACRDVPLHELQNVSKDEVLRHPVWNMGDKITVDSATMVNKGLEIIEASVLFSVPPNNIDVLIHRDSIVHALLHYPDNSCSALLSHPDMMISIAHAIAFPEIIKNSLPPLDLTHTPLKFSHLDNYRYPVIKIAKKVASECYSKKNYTPSIAFLIASEIATLAFLNNLTKFTSITDIVAKTVNFYNNHAKTNSIEAIISLSSEIKSYSQELVNSHLK